MHALKIADRRKVWSWLVSQRGLNTAALVVAPTSIVSHSEENIGTSEMGMLAAVPAGKSRHADGQRCAVAHPRGVQAGYASPVSDGQRIYVVDNGGLFAHDAKTGALVGTEPRHDPEVVAGARGRQALRRHGKRQVLHHPAAPIARRSSMRTGSGASRGPSRSSRRRRSRAAASMSSSMNALYAIGPKMAPGRGGQPTRRHDGAAARPAGVPAAAAGDAYGTDPEAGRVGRAHGEGVRRERRAVAARSGDVDAREPEGHRCRTASSRPTRRAARRPASSRRRSGRLSARRASASSRTCRGPSTSRTAARDAAARSG